MIIKKLKQLKNFGIITIISPLFTICCIIANLVYIANNPTSIIRGSAVDTILGIFIALGVITSFVFIILDLVWLSNIKAYYVDKDKALYEKFNTCFILIIVGIFVTFVLWVGVILAIVNANKQLNKENQEQVS
ncbi:hypothetical protein [[Mycoplasma] cavipharyngis]|uniref:hypothetical protein n=1 Tax=[Mycoplasma] cavipharyngis TaxID=92757 RepID=UPI003703B89F